MRSVKKGYCVVACFGGNANNGTNTGTWYWNLNNDSGNANQNIGTRLTFCSLNKNTIIPTTW
jgi:hypothetical protein